MNRITQIVDKIAGFQVSEDNRYYRAGMFPTQRLHQYLPYKREDSNIYYPALIVMTLQDLLKKIPADYQSKVLEIIAGVQKNYPFYQLQRKPYLYNFFSINPVSNHFPNGYVLSKLRHFKLAEDADVSSIIGLTLVEGEDENFDLLRKELVDFANLSRQQVRVTLPKFKDLPAYGVWFGSGAMPVEFDLCVMTNILCLMFKKGVILNKQDKATLTYIRETILDGNILKDPFSISYIYPKRSVIYYHIARLCSMMKTPEVYLPVAEIIQQIQKAKVRDKGLIDQLLLNLALLKMKENVDKMLVDLTIFEKETKRFGYYIAPMLSGTRNSTLNSLARYSLTHIQYVCPAYYWTLLLEYEVVSK